MYIYIYTRIYIYTIFIYIYKSDLGVVGDLGVDVASVGVEPAHLVDRCGRHGFVAMPEARGVVHQIQERLPQEDMYDVNIWTLTTTFIFNYVNIDVNYDVNIWRCAIDFLGRQMWTPLLPRCRYDPMYYYWHFRMQRVV